MKCMISVPSWLRVGIHWWWKESGEPDWENAHLIKSVPVAASHTAPGSWGFSGASTHISSKNCRRKRWIIAFKLPVVLLGSFAMLPEWCSGREVRMWHLFECGDRDVPGDGGWTELCRCLGGVHLLTLLSSLPHLWPSCAHIHVHFVPLVSLPSWPDPGGWRGELRVLCWEFSWAAAKKS